MFQLRGEPAKRKPNEGFSTANGDPIVVDPSVQENAKNFQAKKLKLKVSFPFPNVPSTKAAKAQYRCPSLNAQIRRDISPEPFSFERHNSDNESAGQSQESQGSIFSSVSNPSVSSAAGLKTDPTLKHFDEHIVDMIESEIMVSRSEISWDDVAGLDGAKKSLREIVVLPFKRPDLFTGIRAPAKGVLLFGPPGTGKTMIGRCVASQCNATFFNISASSLTSKWVGEGEKLVRALFAVARLKLPSVIFIDEIDSLLSARKDSEHESSRRIKTEFLVQLDGIATSSEERLLILGATNRPQELDEAARRRFTKRLYIALPSATARGLIVSSLLDGQKHSVNADDLQEIAEITDGYSGADMRQLCHEASLAPIRDVDQSSVNIEDVSADEIRPICIEDFQKAVKVVRPTVVEEDLVAYKEWDKKFGCLL